MADREPRNKNRLDLYRRLLQKVIEEDQGSGAYGLIAHWDDPDAAWDSGNPDRVWDKIGLSPVIQTLFWVLERGSGEDLETLEALDAYVDPLRCPESALPDIAASFGYRLDETQGEDRKRVAVQGLIQAFKERGTFHGFKVFYRLIGFRIIDIFPLWKKAINEAENDYSRVRFDTALQAAEPVGDGSQIPTPGGNLEGHWPLNNSLADVSGNNRDLTLVGALGFGTANGVRGGVGLDYNTPSPLQNAERPFSDAAFDFAGDFTVSIWARWNTLAVEQVLVEKFTGATGPGWTVTSSVGGTANIRLHWGAPPGPGTFLDTAPATIPNDGLYHHVLVVGSGGSVSIYFDGVLAAGPLAVPALIASPQPLTVGLRKTGVPAPYPMDGDLDELAIWSRALSPAEITALFTAGSSPGQSAFTGKVAEPPVKPGTVRFTDGSIVVRDVPENDPVPAGQALGGERPLIGPNGPAGSINYATGEYILNLGATAQGAVSVSYEQVTEEWPYHAARIDVEISLSPGGVPIPLVDGENVDEILKRMEETRPVHVLLRVLALVAEIRDTVSPTASDTQGCRTKLKNVLTGQPFPGILGLDHTFVLSAVLGLATDEMSIFQDFLVGTDRHLQLFEDDAAGPCPLDTLRIEGVPGGTVFA